MKAKPHWGYILAGLCAGTVNGLFGAGGGMILVPLLTALTNLKEDDVFPASVSIILPITLVSLFFSLPANELDWQTLMPYLSGSVIGGILSGLLGKRIPTLWLHRVLGVLILWGGFRYLC